jgi:hypothetical protein
MTQYNIYREVEKLVDGKPLNREKAIELARLLYGKLHLSNIDENSLKENEYGEFFYDGCNLENDAFAFLDAFDATDFEIEVEQEEENC